LPPQENATQLTKECAEHKRKAADGADELERERVKRRRLDDDSKVRRSGFEQDAKPQTGSFAMCIALHCFRRLDVLSL